jgi:arylsulfatase A-like enzyme
MERRDFLAGLTASFAAGAPQPSNVVVVTADNLGYGDTGCYGNTEIKTPHLDAFARSGVRFTNFYTASPTCTASRAALLTGRHPLRYGLNYQLKPDENRSGIGLPHSEKIIPQYLKRAGYATACFGKWNLGFAPGSQPVVRGFDEFLGIRSGNADYYTHLYRGELDLFQGNQPHRSRTYSTDLFADSACEWLRRVSGQPFFLYLPFNAPHFNSKLNCLPGQKVEWQAPDKYFRRYGYSPSEPDERKRYRAVVTALDDAFGRVMAQIERLRLTSNTLVVFFSDNGAFMLPGRGLEVATNKPLRDGGVTCWEGGIRVAAIARWPGRIPEGAVCDALLSSMDVLPCALTAANMAAPDGARLDGRDPRVAITGKAPSPHEHLCFEWERQQALRRGQWKLIRTEGEPWQLYDLGSDIAETRDVAAAHPEVVSALAAAFDGWRDSLTSL